MILPRRLSYGPSKASIDFAARQTSERGFTASPSTRPEIRWRWWRRRRRDSTVSLDATQGDSHQTLLGTLAESSANPEQETLAHEREVVLRSALRKIGQSYREAVILRDIEGFTYEEIATTLGINVGTVKSRLARGRQELKRKLEGSL